MEPDIEQTIKEFEESFARMKSAEEDAKKEVVKYFDRIHDKLFAYQLFILAGYISLVAIPSIQISPWWLIIPFICVFRLIYIDWRMMEINRKFSNVTNMSSHEIGQQTKIQQNINLNSLEVILETIIVTIGFLCALL